MQIFYFDVGDTTFISLVNAQSYDSFIDEEWDLVSDLVPHVIKEQLKGTILMFQMTSDGIEDDWKIAVSHSPIAVQKYLKKSLNYITVTDRSLYLIEYTNLTMAAQFADEGIPNNTCLPFEIEIENGSYSVTTYLFKDVDSQQIVNDAFDLLFVFEPYTPSLPHTNQEIVWGNY